MRDEAPGAMDRMVIRIERDADDAALRERLIADVQKAVSLRPEVAFAARGAIYDQERSNQDAAGGRSAAEGGLNSGSAQVLGDRCLETGAWRQVLGVHVGALNPVPDAPPISRG